MHLQRLYISNFRNLRDFEIKFTGSTTDSDGTAHLQKPRRHRPERFR